MCPVGVGRSLLCSHRPLELSLMGGFIALRALFRGSSRGGAEPPDDSFRYVSVQPRGAGLAPPLEGKEWKMDDDCKASLTIGYIFGLLLGSGFTMLDLWLLGFIG